MYKDETRKHFSLFAKTNEKYPSFLLTLNPSAFSAIEDEVLKKESTVDFMVKNENSPVGMYIVSKDLKNKETIIKRFDMNLNAKLFGEHRNEVEHRIEMFFGMIPVAEGEATPAYVDQDR